MPDNLLLTTALVLMCGAGIGILILYTQLKDSIDELLRLSRAHGNNLTGDVAGLTQDIAELRHVSKRNFETIDTYVAAYIEGAVNTIREELTADGKLTRERIAQVKTRLADEERDDGKAKSAARRAKAKKAK